MRPPWPSAIWNSTRKDISSPGPHEGVRLSPTEFRLLHFLMVNAGRTMSKAQILEHVWHYDFGGDPSIVDTYISYLRRKVDTREPKLIHTVHGIGYVIRGPRK